MELSKNQGQESISHHKASEQLIALFTTQIEALQSKVPVEIVIENVLRGIRDLGISHEEIQNTFLQLTAQGVIQQKFLLSSIAGNSELELEIADMIRTGQAPEYYVDRPDKKESAVAFLQRVYGRYLVKGQEVLYQDQLGYIDAKLLSAIKGQCSHTLKVPISSYILPKSTRITKELLTISEGKATSRMQAVKRWRKNKNRVS